jgi:hypothetical protein
MDALRALEAQAGAVEDQLLPGERGRLVVVRGVGAFFRASLLGTLPVGIVFGVTWGVQLAGGPGLLGGLTLGVLAGLTPELLRRALLIAGYRDLLSRVGPQGLQAVGGHTSVALPAFVAKKAATPAPPPTPPRFVEPVRPPPRVGDPDADDFDD